MASSRVVLFIGDNPFYLSGYVNSKSYIRGWVENWGYNLYIIKHATEYWTAYRNATSMEDCRSAPQLSFSKFGEAAVTHVVVPEMMRADYNTVINWARNQKREKV